MDGLYRENRVNALLAKLEKARTKDNREYYEEINTELDVITEKIINLDDKEVYPMLTLILSIPLFLITVFSIFKLGFSWRIIPILGLAGFLAYFRIYIIRLYQVKKNFFEKQSQDYVSSRILYVQNGITIKEKRMKLIELMYFIFFPILLFLFADWINHPLSVTQQIILLALAVLIGAGGFLFFFNSIRPNYNDIKAELAILAEAVKE